MQGAFAAHAVKEQVGAALQVAAPQGGGHQSGPHGLSQQGPAGVRHDDIGPPFQGQFFLEAVPGHHHHPGRGAQGPEQADQVLADDAGAIDHHGVPVCREVIQDRLEGRGQGIGEHGRLIGDVIRHPHQPAGVGGHHLGHAAPHAPGEAQNHPGGQLARQEVFAEVVGSLRRNSGTAAPP